MLLNNSFSLHFLNFSRKNDFNDRDKNKKKSRFITRRLFHKNCIKINICPRIFW